VDTALRELGAEDCWVLLRSTDIGRLAVVIHGQPFIFPVNFTIHDSRVIFHTGEGAKLDGVLRTQAVAFEVDGVDPDGEMAWSVILVGHAAPVVDPERLTALRAALPPKWDLEARPFLIEITPEELTGRVSAHLPGLI
jgi:nitroimidazol reductase NimA-like FMN-containing flavoprotein (pyridoxamine 5'-phosphate oxidase superfamily)